MAPGNWLAELLRREGPSPTPSSVSLPRAHPGVSLARRLTPLSFWLKASTQLLSSFELLQVNTVIFLDREAIVLVVPFPKAPSWSPRFFRRNFVSWWRLCHDGELRWFQAWLSFFLSLGTLFQAELEGEFVTKGTCLTLYVDKATIIQLFAYNSTPHNKHTQWKYNVWMLQNYGEK